MKNFVLTLLTAGLALAMATALVIFKTRESIAAGLQPKTVTPPVPVVANEQSPASENFLQFLENVHNGKGRKLSLLHSDHFWKVGANCP